MNLVNTSRAKAGMTLLEIMIAMTILALMMVSVQSVVGQTYKLADTLGEESDFYSGIRLATTIMDRDFGTLFSPAWSLAKNLNALGGDASLATKYWGAPLNQTGIRSARFYGGEKEVRFIAASHVVMYKERRESAFAKISFVLEPDDNPDYPSGTQMLVKIEDTQAFSIEEDALKGRRINRYAILHGIKRWKWNFLAHRDGLWVPQSFWDSEASETRNRYPDIVEADFEVESVRKLNFSAKIKFIPLAPLLR